MFLGRARVCPDIRVYRFRFVQVAAFPEVRV